MLASNISPSSVSTVTTNLGNWRHGRDETASLEPRRTLHLYKYITAVMLSVLDQYRESSIFSSSAYTHVFVLLRLFAYYGPLTRVRIRMY